MKDIQPIYDDVTDFESEHALVKEIKYLDGFGKETYKEYAKSITQKFYMINRDGNKTKEVKECEFLERKNWPLKEEFHFFTKNSCYGVKNSSDEEIIKPEYLYLEKFTDNSFIGSINGKSTRIINDEGDVIIELDEKLSDGTENLKLLTASQDLKQFKVEKNGKIGILLAPGILSLFPSFEDCKFFSEGYCGIKVNGLWGFVDEDGFEKLPPEFVDVGQHSEGWVKVASDKEIGKFKIKKWSWSRLIPNTTYGGFFSEVGDVHDGLAWYKENILVSYLHYNSKEYVERKYYVPKYGFVAFDLI